MDETNKALFALMQNVVDKLENIEKNIKQEKSSDTDQNKNKIINQAFNKSNLKIDVLQSLWSKNIEENNKFKETVLEKLKETEPIVNEIKNEYSLFGSKSIFNYKQLIFFITGLVVVFSAFKFIPKYAVEYSDANQGYKNYKILTEYICLNEPNSKFKDYVYNVLDKIKNNDTILLNEYHKNMKKHKIELRKRELKEELKSLDKK